MMHRSFTLNSCLCLSLSLLLLSLSVPVHGQSQNPFIFDYDPAFDVLMANTNTGITLTRTVQYHPAEFSQSVQGLLNQPIMAAYPDFFLCSPPTTTRNYTGKVRTHTTSHHTQRPKEAQILACHHNENPLQGQLHTNNQVKDRDTLKISARHGKKCIQMLFFIAQTLV